MPALTDRDQRTIRFATIGIAIYLVLFFGFRGWKRLEAKRASYQQLVAKVNREEQDVRAYENRVLLFEKYRDYYQLDPARVPRETVVAEASAAIQSVARQDGLQLGPVRESPGRSTVRELATIQFEGTGPVTAVLGLIQKIQTLGYPVVIDSLQLTPDATRPGTLKLNVTVAILNFDFWKNSEGSNA